MTVKLIKRCHHRHDAADEKSVENHDHVRMKLLSYTDVYFYESEMKMDIQICIFTTIAST